MVCVFYQKSLISPQKSSAVQSAHWQQYMLNSAGENGMCVLSKELHPPSKEPYLLTKEPCGAWRAVVQGANWQQYISNSAAENGMCVVSK